MVHVLATDARRRGLRSTARALTELARAVAMASRWATLREDITTNSVVAALHSRGAKMGAPHDATRVIKRGLSKAALS